MISFFFRFNETALVGSVVERFFLPSCRGESFLQCIRTCENRHVMPHCDGLHNPSRCIRLTLKSPFGGALSSRFNLATISQVKKRRCVIDEERALVEKSLTVNSVLDVSEELVVHVRIPTEPGVDVKNVHGQAVLRCFLRSDMSSSF